MNRLIYFCLHFHLTRSTYIRTYTHNIFFFNGGNCALLSNLFQYLLMISSVLLCILYCPLAFIFNLILFVGLFIICSSYNHPASPTIPPSTPPFVLLPKLAFTFTTSSPTIAPFEKVFIRYVQNPWLTFLFFSIFGSPISEENLIFFQLLRGRYFLQGSHFYR